MIGLCLVSLMMFSSLKELVVSMVHLNVFHWLICSVIIFFLVHVAYVKFVKLLLQKVGLRGTYIIPLINTIWHLCFIAISLPMILHCLEGNLWDSWVVRLDSQLRRCKVHEDIEIPGIKIVFILHTAFSIHEIINDLLNRGFKNLEFFEKQVSLAIFGLTEYSKCTVFGLSLLFLLNWAKAVELVSRLFFLFAQFTNSSSLRNVSKALCGLALVLWIYTFLYIYPVFLTHNKSVDSAMMKAELNMLIVLDFLSWVYLAVSLVNSVFTRVIVSYTMASAERPRTLEYFLFGSKLSDVLLNHPPGSPNLENDSPRSNARRNNRLLCATLKSVMQIKRKVKRIRNEKEKEKQNQPSSSSPGPSSSTPPSPSTPRS